MRRRSACAPRTDSAVRGAEISASPRPSVRRQGPAVHRGRAWATATATTHTAARKEPSKSGGASTRNQRTAIEKLASRKPAAALGPARDGARTGSAEPWSSGSAFGPTAIGADTLYFLSGLTTARVAPSWPGTHQGTHH